MRKCTFILFLILNFYIKGQINLVPNHSFEDSVANNCAPVMIILQPSFSSDIKNWYSSSTFGSPDYFNTCANFFPGNPYPNPATIPYSCRGYQQAHKGNAYCGLATYAINSIFDSTNITTEPMSVKLKAPLKLNTCYYAEFYASLSNISDIAINQLSLYLTSTSFTTASNSYTNSIKPQVQWDTTQFFTDTLNWVKISGTFIAQGGEQYLTISNFRDGAHLNKTFVTANGYPSNCSVPTNSNVSYVFVDDVSLYELPTPSLIGTAYICPSADSLLLGDRAGIGGTYTWFANGVPISNSSQIKVKPTQTTTYVLQSKQCNTTSQTIVVTYTLNCPPSDVVEPIIPNVFTPNDDGVNDVWQFNIGLGNTLKSLGIYNRWGLEIHTMASRASASSFNSTPVVASNPANMLWDGRTTSGEPCTAGVYFYMLEYINLLGDTVKKNGYITLIR
jgi:gliding motility-associated-like protein